MFDLYSIKDPTFIKGLTVKELKELASEIRSFLIEHISKTGGHLSSNLGVVEITLAMYYVFDLDDYEFLFDVGHQSYVHKILTGRASEFDNLRQYGGISGYISREESPYDVWESGHSSTSISAAAGLMLANDKKRSVVLIGDSSITNGVSFEGLNFVGQFKGGKTPIIILNDNKMGISKSVGALTKAFQNFRGTKFVRHSKNFMQKILPNFLVASSHRIKSSIKALFQHDNIFEAMGFDYYGPYYGNKIEVLIKLFQRIKNSKSPVVLHVLTQKGRGYKPSEEDTSGNFHGVGPFDVETGKPLNSNPDKISYSAAVADYLVHKREERKFYVITPAMKAGAQLDEFAKTYPESLIDVGIAEEHAAVMSCGIALNHMDVVLLMYSTFAQRAYDEFLNDMARQDLKVIIGIDRAGIVGEDGVTHQGLYDVAMFMAMPNVVVTMPKDVHEAIGLFNYAFNQNHPFVIRYPRLSVKKEEFDYTYVTDLKWDILHDGKKKIVISYGEDINRINHLVESNNLDIKVVNAKCIKPLDEDMLHKLFKENLDILVIEQVVASGTLYHRILEFKEMNGYQAKVIKHSFGSESKIPHGKISEIYKHFDFSDDDFLKLLEE